MQTVRFTKRLTLSTVVAMISVVYLQCCSDMGESQMWGGVDFSLVVGTVP